MGARTSAVMYAAFVTVASTASMAAADEALSQQQLLDRAEIEELVTRYVTALDTRDADMYAGVFTEDGVFELPGDVVHRGRAAIRKICEGFPVGTVVSRMGTLVSERVTRKAA